MTDAHHVLLANGLRNIASAMRSERRRGWGRAPTPQLEQLDDWALSVERIANEIDGYQPPWFDDHEPGEDRGSVELTDRGRAYEP